MLFWVSKLINPLLSPLTLAILVPAAALAWTLFGGKRSQASADRDSAGPAAPVLSLRETRGRRFAAAGLVALGLLYLASLPAASNLLVRMWETERTDPAALESDPNAPFDAIVVLGGSVSVELSEGWHVETGQSMERIVAAARLYRALSAPKVIVTGGSGNPAFQDRAEAPLMLRLLTLMGVKEEDVLLEATSRNTYENAVFTKKVMEGAGLRSALLVTSALHMPRARAVFAKQGIAFAPFAVDTSLDVVTPPNGLFPDTVALDNTYRTLREMAGYVAYRAMGRL